MPALFIVATPIGNLLDFTLRAVNVLKNVDLILCEDTRTTKKLLEHYQIKTPALSYHQHSKIQKIDYIIRILKEGKNLALVSDAGTPGISDPGNKLIAQLNNCLIEQLEITPVPGPSALTAAASISGFPMDRFLFLGFPPAKKKRKRFFEEVINSKYPVIFYESPHRIIRTLKELSSFAGDSLEIVACRELTKKFEQILRGTIKEVLDDLEKSEIRGEFAVIVKNKQR